MPRYTYIQNSFGSGQISPKLEGRTDVAEYKGGLKEMTNMFPYKAGGAERRPGFRDSGRAIKGRDGTLATFIDECSYHSYMGQEDKVYEVRFFTTKEDIDPGNKVLADVQDVETGAILPITFTLNSALVLSFLSSGKLIKTVQAGKILVAVSSDGTMPPILIHQKKDGTFHGRDLTDTFSNYDPATDPSELQDIVKGFAHPTMDANTSDITVTPSVAQSAGAAITLTASDDLFTADMFGSVWTIDTKEVPPAATRWITPPSYIVRLGAFVSATEIAATVLYIQNPSSAFVPSVQATDYWYEAAWSDKNGWPRLVTYYQNRLIFLNTKNQPNGVWASEVGRFCKLNKQYVNIFIAQSTDGISDAVEKDIYSRTPVYPAGAFNVAISSSKADDIQWVSSSRNLVLGTLSSEFVVTSNQSFLSAASIAFTRQSSFGSDTIRDVEEVGGAIYFIANDGESIVELAYSDENGGYVSRDLGALFDGISVRTKDVIEKFESLTWDNDSKVLWILSSLGSLYGITLNDSSKVKAFHRLDIEGEVLNVVKHPYDRGTRVPLEVYIDSSARTLIGDGPERDAYQMLLASPYTTDIAGNFWETITPEDNIPFYLDHSERVVGPGTSWPVKLVDGTAVDIVANDGTVYRNVTVAGGNILTPTIHDEIVYGIPYMSRIKTLVHEVGPNQILSSQGDLVRVDQTTLLLYKTYAAQYGSEDTDLYDVEDIPTTGFTGRVQVDMPQNPANDNRIVVESDYPLPMSVLGIVLRGVNNQ